MPTGVNNLDLLDLDSKGAPITPPKSRVHDVGAASGLYKGQVRADEKSCIARARTDAMFDGAPPYDPRILKSTGQGHRCNLNFGEGQRLLDTAMAGYVDLLSSVPALMVVQTVLGEDGAQLRNSRIVADELTRTIRHWPAFHSSFLRLATQFIKHGVGVSYFEDSMNWRFRASGLSDFVIPRQTLASEDAIEVAFAKTDYMVHELYKFIQNSEAAEKRGWTPDEVKRVIRVANRNTMGARVGVMPSWEAVERELKNNDVISGYEAKKVSVVHMWVREMDQTISHFMFAEDAPEAWIYQRVGKFKTSDQAFILFAYGTGNNGTYHSIRGLGQRIFAHVQVSNRLRCQMVDGAAMASTVMLRPDSPRALDDLSYAYWGPYSVLSDKVEIVDKPSPNLSNSVIPAVNNLAEQLRESSDFYSTQGAATGSPYQTELQVQARLESASRLASANLSLFYASWHRLMRETSRRIITGPSSDPEIREFFERCEARGVSREVVKSVDHRKTYAWKAVGAGNAGARAAAIADLEQMLPELQEAGKKNLLYDRAASRVGYEMADRYVSESVEPEYSVELQLAEMENRLMMSGQSLPVHSGMMHETHLEAHLPFVAQTIQGIEIGEIDPMEALSGLRAALQHVSEHAQQLGGRNSANGMFRAAREVLNNAGNIVDNMERKIRALQRKAQEESAAAEGPEGGPGEGQELMDLKRAAAELDMQIKRETANLNMEIKQAAAAQDRALKDAKTAQELNG